MADINGGGRQGTEAVRRRHGTQRRSWGRGPVIELLMRCSSRYDETEPVGERDEVGVHEALGRVDAMEQ
jgi:hypothetical protein